MTRPIRPHLAASALDHRRRVFRRLAVPMLAATATMLVTVNSPASAAPVPNISLGTAANYSVLGGSTVTNTGPSVLDKSVGLAPGSAVEGFPPGTVTPPGTIQAANAVSLQAKLDLTAAYLDAEVRAGATLTTADLTGQTLIPGLYSEGTKGPLSLTGALTLDGQGDPNAVFIFQTNSSLTTFSGSSITLINSASECNVFWQVGSSATVGTGSTFVGNILALESITVTTGANVHGRALARNGAVTLDTNVFTSDACALAPGGAPAATTTTIAAAPVDTTPASTIATTVPLIVTDITLPNTGRSQVVSTTSVAVVALLLGAAALMLARRRRSAA